MIETTKTALLEPSCSDVAKAIEPASDLSAQIKSHWRCSMVQIAKAMDRPLDTIAARWTAVRPAIDRLHHARVGMNEKTLANHKSNARAALRWFAGVQDLPTRGIPFIPEWHQFALDCPTEGRARCCPP